MRPPDLLSLPEGLEWTSLWSCLHDGVLEKIADDPLERTVTLQILLGFPKTIQGSPEHAQFIVQGVKGIYVTQWKPWPGPYPQQLAGMPTNEWQKLINKDMAKGRGETATVDGLRKFAESNELDIIDAAGALGNDMVALDLRGVVQSTGGSFSFVVVGNSLGVCLDGTASSISELMTIGERSWEKWGERHPAEAE